MVGTAGGYKGGGHVSFTGFSLEGGCKAPEFVLRVSLEIGISMPFTIYPSEAFFTEKGIENNSSDLGLLWCVGTTLIQN
jgi:hypothetical protein